jgi:hypothetical protein
MRDVDNADTPKISDRPTAIKTDRRRWKPVERLKQGMRWKVIATPQGGERLTKDVTNENLVRFDGP